MKLCKNSIWKKFVRDKLEEMGKSRRLLDGFCPECCYINGEPYIFIPETKEDLTIYKQVVRHDLDHYNDKAETLKEQNDPNYHRPPKYSNNEEIKTSKGLGLFPEPDENSPMEIDLAHKLHEEDLDKLKKNTPIITKKDIKTLYIQTADLAVAQEVWKHNATYVGGIVATSKEVFGESAKLMEFENSKTK